MSEFKNMYLGVCKNTPYIIDISLINCIYASMYLNRNFTYTTTSGSALTVTRTTNFRALKENILKNNDSPADTYVMLMDSDILINMDYKALAKCMKDAEDKNINIIGEYKRGDGKCLLKEIKNNDNIIWNTEDYKNSDIRYISMNNYLWTIGFYYGKLNLDYEFKMDMIGEDYHFITDNPNITTYLDKDIKLLHYKSNYV